jgi:mannose-6-phosphate isomerase-like protein (cupin superfamily)
LPYDEGIEPKEIKMEQLKLNPIVLQNGQGHALWHFGALMNFKALTEETGGQYWAVEGLADQNMAVPLHSHTREDEVWFVIEGEIAFVLGDETIVGGAGTFVYIPRNTPHTFYIKSQTARWFGFGIGGNLDQWFFETGEPAKTMTLPPPPPGPPTEAAIEAINASLKAYGTDTLGPPPNMGM